MGARPAGRLAARSWSGGGDLGAPGPFRAPESVRLYAAVRDRSPGRPRALVGAVRRSRPCGDREGAHRSPRRDAGTAPELRPDRRLAPGSSQPSPVPAVVVPVCGHIVGRLSLSASGSLEGRPRLCGPAGAFWYWPLRPAPRSSRRIGTGSSAPFTTTLFVVAILLDASRRPVLSGVVIGLAFYKPNLVLPAAAIWLVGRQWELLGGLCLGAIASRGHRNPGRGTRCQRWRGSMCWRSLLGIHRVVQGFPEEVHSLSGLLAIAGRHGLSLTLMSGTFSVVALGSPAALASGFYAAAALGRTHPGDRAGLASPVDVRLVAPDARGAPCCSRVAAQRR